MPLPYLLSLIVTGTCDILPTNGIFKKWWMSLPWLITQNYHLCLLADSLLPSWLAWFNEARGHVGEDMWQESVGSLWPKKSRKKDPSAKTENNKSHQIPGDCGSRQFPNGALQMRPQVWLTSWLQLCGRPKTEDPDKPCLDSWPIDHEIISVCCFRSLSFW